MFVKVRMATDMVVCRVTCHIEVFAPVVTEPVSANVFHFVDVEVSHIKVVMMKIANVRIAPIMMPLVKSNGFM